MLLGFISGQKHVFEYMVNNMKQNSKHWFIRFNDWILLVIPSLCQKQVCVNVLFICELI